MSKDLSSCRGARALLCGPRAEDGDDGKAVDYRTHFYVCEACGDPCGLAPGDKAMKRPRRDKMVRAPQMAK
jgi:hypothetical protein